MGRITHSRDTCSETAEPGKSPYCWHPIGFFAAFRTLFALVAALAIVACAGGGGAGTAAPPPPPPPGAAVVITSFTAGNLTLSANQGTILTPTFTNATAASIDHGVGTVTSGAGYAVTPSETTTYTLTAQGVGGPVSRSVTLMVLPVPNIASFLVSPNALPQGGSATLTATFSNGTGAIDQGIGPVSSTVGVGTGALTGSRTYTLTVANGAGGVATQTATVTVAAVGISAISPATPTRTVSTTTSFSAMVSGALDPGIAWSASAGSITAGGLWTAPSLPGSCTITASSTQNPTISSSTLVTVVAAPVIDFFGASPAAIPTGTAANLTAIFSNGTGSLDNGIGAIASGGAISTGALTANRTFTLTVTNAAGTSATATTTVAVGSAVAITSFTAARALITAGQSTSLTPLFVNATSASINNGVGPVSSGAGYNVTPAATSQYTLTAQGLGGPVTQSVTVTVLPAPVITSFAATPATIPYGGTTTLTGTFQDGNGSIDLGIGNVATGVGAATGVLTASQTYTLTVTNSAGDSSTQSATVTVTPVVVSAVTPASPTRTVATVTPFSATVSGTSNVGLTWSASAGSITAGGIWTAPAVAGPCTITARSLANAAVFSSTVVTVVAAPAITSFSASPGAIANGAGSTLTAIFSNGTAAVDHGIGAVTSNVGVATGALVATTTYTLTVTNAAGTQVMGSTAVTVAAQALPSITSFTATPSSLTMGQSSTLAWVVTGATTISIDQGVGGVGGSNTSVSPTAPTTFTLSATNGGGTVTATASVTVGYSVTFVAGAGGTLSGILSQAVAYDGSCTTVTPTPTTGYAFVNWTGTGFTTSVSNPLTLTNVTTNHTLTANFAPLDLATWLGNHANVAGAIKWQFVAADMVTFNYYAPPTEANKITWSNWSGTQKSDLNQAYLDACAWLVAGANQVTMPYAGLTDEPTNTHPQINNDAVTCLQRISVANMWKLFVGHVGFSLALEITGQVPWSVTTYIDPQLRYLYDSTTMGWLLPSGDFGLGTYGGSFASVPALRANNLPKTTFASPMWTYPFLKQAGIVSTTSLSTIGNTLDWMRWNLWHFYGNDSFGNFNANWQYRGYSPLSKIIQGTTSTADLVDGVQHWTAGCHGSVGFLHALLRVVNIPVQPIWITGHELAFFMTDNQYLDHGDDPYNANVKTWTGSILNVLIDEATYQSWFSNDLTVNISASNPANPNIGRKATESH